MAVPPINFVFIALQQMRPVLQAKPVNKWERGLNSFISVCCFVYFILYQELPFSRFKAQPTVAAVAAAAVVQLLMRRLLLLLMLLSSTAKTCESSLNRVSQKHAFDFQTLSLAV